jgi:hypothetical protein
MVLYKKKNADLAPVDNALDRLLLLLALTYPSLPSSPATRSVGARPRATRGRHRILETILLAATVAVALAGLLRQCSAPWAATARRAEVSAARRLRADALARALTPMPHNPSPSSPS